MRGRTGSAAAPAARCRNFLRGSFIGPSRMWARMRARTELHRLDLFDRALPAAFGDVEHDAFRRLVFYFVVDVRACLLAAGDIAAARVGDLLGALVEVVDPHAEMDETERVLLVLHSGARLVAEVQERAIGRAP